jgi:hypothetical protein
MAHRDDARALSDAQIAQFIAQGFVRIDNAFPREFADQARAIMWRDLPCSEHDPSTWTRPVVRLPGYGGAPFRRAIDTPLLHRAFDQIAGPGRWRPRHDIGTFPVRFPHPDDPGDAGWHVDVSFPGDDCDPNERSDFSAWRVNIVSRGRALLMLFLLSDVGEHDAPTRIRVGSHFPMARYLAPAGAHAWCSTRSAPTARSRWRQARRGRSICAIPFWCMRRRCTGERRRASWRSRRSAPASRTGSGVTMAPIRRSRSRSGTRSAWANRTPI